MFYFIAWTMTLIIDKVVIFFVCTHTKLKCLVQVLQQIEGISSLELYKSLTGNELVCTYRLQWWTVCMLYISLIGITAYSIIRLRQFKLSKDIYFLIQ